MKWSQFEAGRKERVAQDEFAVGAVLSHIGYLEALKILHPTAAWGIDGLAHSPSPAAGQLAKILLDALEAFRQRVDSPKSCTTGGLLNVQPQGPPLATRRDERIVDNGRFQEEHFTSLLTSLLPTLAVGTDRKFVWLHQPHDSLKHALDIVLAEVVQGVSGLDFVPILIVEVGVKDKVAQLFSYVYNVWVSDEQLGQRNRLALGLQLQLTSSGGFDKIVLHGYRQAYVKTVDKHPRALLTDVELATIDPLKDQVGELPIEEQLARIFECVLQCGLADGWEGSGSCQAPISQTVVSCLKVPTALTATAVHDPAAATTAAAAAPAPDTSSAAAPAVLASASVAAPVAVADVVPAPGLAVVPAALSSVQQERVFKAFSSTSDRRPQPSLKFLNAQFELKNVKIGQKSVTIISYPYIPGCHLAQNVAQFVAVVRQMRKMHASGWCHADVREANIVFSFPVDGSRLIDFDFAYHPGESDTSAKYPPRWNGAIDDGVRHPDARSGAAKRLEHDTFSLHSVMCLYEPVPEPNSPVSFEWNAWVSLLQPPVAAAAPTDIAQQPHTTELLDAFLRAVEKQPVQSLTLRRRSGLATPTASAAQGATDFCAYFTGTPQ